MLTTQRPDSITSSTPVHSKGRLIGMLVEDASHRYRFAALDGHFDLLDGSRFATLHGAQAAVMRLSRFINQPVAANEA
jgi:hypothetical protein